MIMLKVHTVFLIGKLQGHLTLPYNCLSPWNCFCIRKHLKYNMVCKAQFSVVYRFSITETYFWLFIVFTFFIVCLSLSTR